ncbi:MAG: hypothetical protein ACFB2X_18510 [Rivularia sp. (in: cyanobacteria)]
MKLPLDIQSLPIVTSTKDMTHLKYGARIKWTLYDDLTVKYEWHCPEKNHYRKQEMEFDNLPLDIRVMLAKKVIRTPLLKILESGKQLMLVRLAVISDN